MRFLHTSDWHLGRGIGGHSLTEAQEVAIDFLITTAIEQQVQAFVIAGDLFDRAYPGVEDVRRLNAALVRIHQAGIPIIMTSGNHDEGSRLAAYMHLLDDGVHVVGRYEQVGGAVALRDEHGPVLFYPLPYLDPDGARRALAPAPDALLTRSHEAVMAEAMRRVRDDLAARRAVDASTRAVVVAHAFVVTGRETPAEVDAERSESERDIAVGGLPTVPSAVFDGVQYVALGHLHGPREVDPGKAPMIRYSGSLLRYSMSEATHIKSCTIVDMDAAGNCSATLIPVPQPAGMVRLTGTVAELCSEAHAGHRDDFVDLHITDDRLDEHYQALLRHHFSRIVNIVRQRPGAAQPTSATPHERMPSEVLQPIDRLLGFYAEAAKLEPTPAIRAILQDALERAGKGA